MCHAIGFCFFCGHKIKSPVKWCDDCSLAALAYRPGVGDWLTQWRACDSFVIYSHEHPWRFAVTSHHLMTIYILNQIFLYFYFILLFARFGTASQNESNNAKSCEQKACESEMRWRIRFFFFNCNSSHYTFGKSIKLSFCSLATKCDRVIRDHCRS